MNCRAVLLWRNSSSSQNSPFTVTSMTSSGVSLQVARCTTCVTPAIALAHDVALRDRPARNLDPLRLVDDPSVAKRSDACTGTRLIGEQASDETPPDLAGRARYQDQHALPPADS